MNQIEKNKSKTDQAWAQLYTRLEQDGLLDKPISGTQIDRKSTRLNSSHSAKSRMPSSA